MILFTIPENPLLLVVSKRTGDCLVGENWYSETVELLVEDVWEVLKGELKSKYRILGGGDDAGRRAVPG